MEFLRVLVELIDPNPWQGRIGEDAEHVAAICDSIRENREKGKGEGGLLQVPMGRRVDGRVQLAFGMTRLAAWKLLPPEPFPVNLEALTDLEMSDKGVFCNGGHRALFEKANKKAGRKK